MGKNVLVAQCYKSVQIEIQHFFASKLWLLRSVKVLMSENVINKKACLHHCVEVTFWRPSQIDSSFSNKDYWVFWPLLSIVFVWRKALRPFTFLLNLVYVSRLLIEIENLGRENRSKCQCDLQLWYLVALQGSGFGGCCTTEIQRHANFQNPSFTSVSLPCSIRVGLE